MKSRRRFRRNKPQAAPVETDHLGAPPLSPGRRCSGRGLVKRPRAWIVRRSVVRVLAHPAVAPVVAVAAVGILAALLVGIVIGTAIAAGREEF